MSSRATRNDGLASPFRSYPKEDATAKKASVSKGDAVEYQWGKGTVEGEVTKVHTDDIEKTIKGNKVKREASKSEPAVEVRTDKGAKVLKSTSEVKLK